MNLPQAVIDWLLDSDPAIRWQVMKDILHSPPAVYAKERARLAQEGWCAQLLSLQGDDDLWNSSLYNGKWLSTTYSLYLLKLLGLESLHPAALAGCQQLLIQGLYQEEEIRFSRRQDIQDLGVTALVLSLCSYFGSEAASLVHIAHFLARQQNTEGNWLPNHTSSASFYAFETTLLVLEALFQFTQRHPTGEYSAIYTAIRRGQEYLLSHHLGIVEGKLVKSQWNSFSFPCYWFYDLLTGLDYFCACQIKKDCRIQPAIDALRSKQTRAGVWLLGRRHPGKTYFDMEETGQPSRWNTLRALRILAWWEEG